jgi:23S rRNA pseudouridine2605 synthase
MPKNDQLVRDLNRATPRNASERKVGLARAISKLGYCSRSKAAELIRAGQVRVNGVARKNVESPVHIEKDRLEIGGRPVGPSQKIYLMMNKPRGVVSTASDERGRETVYAWLEKSTTGEFPWVAPVGRLDKASEGLLLLTNDSEWAARITAPSTHVDKTYHVQLAGQLTATQVQNLEQGFTVKDGEFLSIKSARPLRQGERNSWVEIILDEGRNRHIRRMFEKIGVEVLRLIRVSIGALELGALPKGAVRALNEKEMVLLLTKSGIV